jgi:YD repeat-containing protein
MTISLPIAEPPTTITRPNGAITTMTYDAKGNLLTSTESSIAATTVFTYELAFNQVTRITDPKGNQTNITYDVKRTETGSGVFYLERFAEPGHNLPLRHW